MPISENMPLLVLNCIFSIYICEFICFIFIDLVGLLINSLFEKSDEEAIESSYGIVDDNESDMQIVLRNEFEDQTVGIDFFLPKINVDYKMCKLF